MSTTPFEHLVKQIEQLTPAEKDRLEKLLHSFKRDEPARADALSPGWARGLVISDDFDEPLKDFEDYLPS